MILPVLHGAGEIVSWGFMICFETTVYSDKKRKWLCKELLLGRFLLSFMLQSTEERERLRFLPVSETRKRRLTKIVIGIPIFLYIIFGKVLAFVHGNGYNKVRGKQQFAFLSNESCSSFTSFSMRQIEKDTGTQGIFISCVPVLLCGFFRKDRSHCMKIWSVFRFFRGCFVLRTGTEMQPRFVSENPVYESSFLIFYKKIKRYGF